MNGVLKNYFSTVLLLTGVIAGAVLGAIWPEVDVVAGPVGDAFINILFVLVVPLVFFSVTLAWCRMCSGHSLGRTLARMLAVFVLMWVVFGVISYIGTLLYDISGEVNRAGLSSGSVLNGISGTGPVTSASDGPDSLPAMSSMFGDLPSGSDVVASSARGGGFASAVSVRDFPELFSKLNLLPLIVFSSLLGVGIYAAGEKGRPLYVLLDSCNEVTAKTMDILMKVAPLGLGCYIASTIAREGLHVIGGYMRFVLLYCALTVVLFFVVNPALIFFVRGKSMVRSFWRNIIPPSLTALATSSSAAAMPGNINAAKRMGVDADVADCVVPLATNLLKAGSVVAGVLKVVFAMNAAGMPSAGFVPALTCCGIAVLAGAVTGAVVNGGVTSGVLICSMLGIADPGISAALMILGTLVDIPATLLNSQSNVVAAALVDGRHSSAS